MMKLDPRTHIVTMILMSICVFLYEESWQYYVLLGASFIYMAINGQWKKAMYGIFMYMIFILSLYLLPHVFPALGVFIFTMTRVFPVFMIGTVLLAGRGSEILFALDRLKVPKPIVIIVMILLRFFPVILLEMKTIYQGIRVRGIFPTVFHVIKQPLIAYECFVVPLTFRCLKLSNELAAAAELRGIACNVKRTSIHEEKKHLNDRLMIVFSLAVSILVLAGVNV